MPGFNAEDPETDPEPMELADALNLSALDVPLLALNVFNPSDAALALVPAVAMSSADDNNPPVLDTLPVTDAAREAFDIPDRADAPMPKPRPH